MKSYSLVSLVTIALIAMAAAYPARGAEPLGLSKSKPAQGRYVETEQGFMVPYTIEIPGTGVEFTMQPIPGGRFKMGSPAAEPHRQPDEGPQIDVTVEPFWMAATEITWAEYQEFMDLYSVFKDFETRNIRVVSNESLLDAITAPTELYDPTFTFEYGEEPQQPAVTMTQYAAKQYTKWLSAVTGHNYRLPSEAEWEYACRAGTRTAYFFGDDPAQLAEYGWYYDNATEAPQAVGTKKPNPWGLFDMHGNVWEWVLDEYFEDGYQRLAGKQVTAQEAIAWPTKPYPRVVRGGSWEDDAEVCRAASKMGSHDEDWKEEDPNLPLSPWWFTSDPSRGVGFRLMRPLKRHTKQEMARYWDADVEDLKFDIKCRLEEGRGALGLVDPQLPAAIKQLEASR